MEMIQWKRLADFLLFDKDLTSNMALQHKTIDNYCRLCAIESQSGVIIYSTEGENLCLEEKIISCLRIEVIFKVDVHSNESSNYEHGEFLNELSFLK